MSRDRAPLYSRMLRLRHLTLRPVVAFLLFEGSIGLGALAALADFTSGWGMVAVPLAVAVMVKLNDLVAGGITAAAGSVGPAIAGPAIGVSPAPRSRPEPIRGASARRTREIVGRARLGSARGIVYVHPKPGSLRRPPDACTAPDDTVRDSSTTEPADPASTEGPVAPTTAPETEPDASGSMPDSGSDIRESPSGDIARNKGRFDD